MRQLIAYKMVSLFLRCVSHMMMLLFQLDDDRYGMDVKVVVEVIPRVPLQRLPRMPDYVAGLLNYRGEVLPVLDMSVMFNERNSQPYLSTRVIITKIGSAGQLVGLMAENVAETIKVQEKDFVDTRAMGDVGAFVDAVIIDGHRMIQKVDVNKILTEDVQRFIAYAGDMSELAE